MAALPQSIPVGLWSELLSLCSSDSRVLHMQQAVPRRTSIISKFFDVRLHGSGMIFSYIPETLEVSAVLIRSVGHNGSTCVASVKAGAGHEVRQRSAGPTSRSLSGK
eukprot:s221_g2.t1